MGYIYPLGMVYPFLFLWRYIMSKIDSKAAKFSNVFANGTGFINNIRRYNEDVENGYSLSINAFRGKHDQSGKAKNSTRFDLRLINTEAGEIIMKLLNDYPVLLDPKCKDKPTIYACFTASDIEAFIITRKKYDREAKKLTDEVENVPTIKGRLFSLSYLSVNGEVYYRPAPQERETVKPETMEESAYPEDIFEDDTAF